MGFFLRFDYMHIAQVSCCKTHCWKKHTVRNVSGPQKREAMFKVIYAFIGVLLLVLCVDAAPKSLILLFGPSASDAAA